jgi:ABC-type transporter Mla subunit MlaD
VSPKKYSVPGQGVVAELETLGADLDAISGRVSAVVEELSGATVDAEMSALHAAGKEFVDAAARLAALHVRLVKQRERVEKLLDAFGTPEWNAEELANTTKELGETLQGFEEDA